MNADQFGGMGMELALFFGGVTGAGAAGEGSWYLRCSLGLAFT